MSDQPEFDSSASVSQQIIRPSLSPQVVKLKGAENFHEWLRTLKLTLSFYDLEEALTEMAEEKDAEKA